MNYVCRDENDVALIDFSSTVTGQHAVATPTNVAAPDPKTRTVSSVRIRYGSTSETTASRSRGARPTCPWSAHRAPVRSMG